MLALSWTRHTAAASRRKPYEEPMGVVKLLSFASGTECTLPQERNPPRDEQQSAPTFPRGLAIVPFLTSRLKSQRFCTFGGEGTNDSSASVFA
eukprot:1954549-Amphidinium_carterae.2